MPSPVHKCSSEDSVEKGMAEKHKNGKTTPTNPDLDEIKRGTKLYNKIANRSISAKLTQLRTGHCALNGYLHRFGKKDSCNVRMWIWERNSGTLSFGMSEV